MSINMLDGEPVEKFGFDPAALRNKYRDECRIGSDQDYQIRSFQEMRSRSVQVCERRSV